MKFLPANNSVVVIAANHNPSVVTKAFLRDTSLINDLAEIDESSILITPAISQIIWKNGTSLHLDPDRLTLTSLAESDQASDLADKYCLTLPFIRGTAVGINFVFTVTELDILSWFQSLKSIKYEGAHLYSLDIKFSAEENVTCNVKVTLVNASQGNIVFNFHRDLLATGLGKLNFSILEKKTKYQKVARDFLDKLFI